MNTKLIIYYIYRQRGSLELSAAPALEPLGVLDCSKQHIIITNVSFLEASPFASILAPESSPTGFIGDRQHHPTSTPILRMPAAHD